jgi:four helix bundle protein
MTADELKLRTKRFALRVIKLVAALPKTIEGRAIANQLVRCGTSVAANYRAACRARSRSEFVEPLLEEASELVAIFVASRKSASSNLRSTI